MKTKRIGVDLGGTNLRAGIVDETGTIICEESISTEAEKGPDHVIRNMIALIKKVKENHEVTSIGIGSPGPLDPYKGLVLSPPNLPGWVSVPLTEKLKQAFDIPVYLDNDANAAALAEASFGSGNKFSSVFFITVSTGIGGGYVLDNKIVQGAQGYAGEIGNMILQPGGPSWSNLNAGSFEALASGTAIGREGKERLGIQGGAEEVFEMAAGGNPVAQIIIDETVTYLAMGIANIAHIVNPSIFVLGGGVMQAKGQILNPLRTKVKDFLYPGLQETINLQPAKLGTKAGLIGASLLGSDPSKTVDNL
ncbi:ROK family protein [Pseudalkalibacillus caeni]|uniref:ROK family protein n=2 Tax=Exobacillus caeni TaxID=2574798 RepID=A0A5R9F7S1_9BACL|nr:ROK family protein [Pseudalkalibacillus caeni]